jgi:hypothetical protein
MDTEVASGQSATSTDVTSNGSAGNTVANTSSQVENREAEFLQKFGLLSKREQQLLQKERALADKEKNVYSYEEISRLAQTDPDAFLERFGLSYGKLTERALRGDSGKDVSQLEEKINKIETEWKSDIQKRRENEERAALQTVMTDIRTKVGTGEEFELVNAYQAHDDVWELMTMHYQEHKEWLPIEKAAAKIEEELRERAEKLVNTKYLSSKFQAKTPPETQAGQSQQGNSNTEMVSSDSPLVRLARERLHSNPIARTLGNGMVPQSAGSGDADNRILTPDDLRDKALKAFQNVRKG